MFLDRFSRLGSLAVILIAPWVGPRGWMVAVLMLGLELSLEFRRRLPLFIFDDDLVRSLFRICLCTETLVMVAVVVEWPMTGTWLLMAGSLMNVSVVAANGMRMPARGSCSHQPFYIGLCPQVRLRWLSDIIAVPGRNGIWFYSIGDVAIIIGIWVFPAQLVLMRFVG